jgi:hypothetical protein
MWQGEVYDRAEARAALHTHTALVPRIVERLDAEHPYEVPGVIALPVVATSPAYRAWMLAQTVRPPATRSHRSKQRHLSCCHRVELGRQPSIERVRSKSE